AYVLAIIETLVSSFLSLLAMFRYFLLIHPTSILQGVVVSTIVVLDIFFLVLGIIVVSYFACVLCFGFCSSFVPSDHWGELIDD
ncbi:1665_t:CDS:2, partial [Dentiscutata heterogama]